MKPSAFTRACIAACVLVPHLAGAATLDEERAKRAADIAFYASGYDGGPVKLTCVRPILPPTSKTNAEIASVDGAVTAWFECYNAFVQRLNDALPPTKAIPADLLRIMNPQELARAQAHMNNVFETISDGAQQDATTLQAEHQAWRDSTMLFATTQNAETKRKIAARIVEFELSLQRRREMTEGSNDRAMTGGRAISK